MSLRMRCVANGAAVVLRSYTSGNNHAVVNSGAMANGGVFPPTPRMIVTLACALCTNVIQTKALPRHDRRLARRKKIAATFALLPVIARLLTRGCITDSNFAASRTTITTGSPSRRVKRDANRMLRVVGSRRLECSAAAARAMLVRSPRLLFSRPMQQQLTLFVSSVASVQAPLLLQGTTGAPIAARSFSSK
jgi:hypothetical protein